MCPREVCRKPPWTRAVVCICSLLAVGSISKEISKGSSCENRLKFYYGLLNAKLLREVFFKYFTPMNDMWTAAEAREQESSSFAGRWCGWCMYPLSPYPAIPWLLQFSRQGAGKSFLCEQNSIYTGDCGTSLAFGLWTKYHTREEEAEPLSASSSASVLSCWVEVL